MVEREQGCQAPKNKIGKFANGGKKPNKGQNFQRKFAEIYQMNLETTQNVVCFVGNLLNRPIKIFSSRYKNAKSFYLWQTVEKFQKATLVENH